MKKGFICFLLLIFTVQLVACRNNDRESVKAATGSTTKTTSESSTTASFAKNLSESEFKSDSFHFMIQDTEQLENEDGVPILAIKARFTNHSDQAITPWLAFITNIRTIQKVADNDQSLTGANGLFPEDYQPELVKAGEERILPGESVETLIGFVIENPGTPVLLTDLSLLDHPEQFQREILTAE